MGGSLLSARTLILVPLLGLALTGAACSSGGDVDGEPSAGGVPVTLTDFAIEPAETSAPAGSVSFAVTNEGPSVHEFEVLRTDTPADALPVDGGVVQTSAAGIEIVDEIEQITPSTEAELTVDLEPATYALICNISGHYDSGMFASFTVE